MLHNLDVWNPIGYNGGETPCQLARTTEILMFRDEAQVFEVHSE